MSENKNIPEIIYIPNYSFAEYFAQKDVTCISENVNIRTDKKEVELSSIKHQEYILKSKYDELLKEKEELEDKLENCEILKAACERANAEMQGTRSATYHQLCPKCNGQGIVQKPPHVAGDVNEWISSNTIYTCDVCNGNKTLIMPIEIKPTEKE